MAGKVGDQRVPVAATALTVAQRVELEPRIAQHAEIVQDPRTAGDHFEIGLRLLDADQFHADLVKLAQPSFLRSFVAEHGAAIEKLDRHALRQPLGDETARHAGCILWPQGNFVAALVDESVHLLRHDIRRIAQGSLEHLAELEHRRGHFIESITCGRFACGIGHTSMGTHFIGQEIVRTAHGL